MNVIENNIIADLHNIARKIAELVPGSKTILFGSYARGDQTIDSDLDLCVLVPDAGNRHTDIRLMVRGAIRNETDIPLDVIVYSYDEFEHSSQYKTRLPYSIKEEGIVLDMYDKEGVVLDA